ncbi:MAG: phosphoribosylamine--glycine ligase [Deltaproteobacteria bacterium]|nr:phosphoribosylamine--glycine ligase [Deltaproteobacteria bacterium]
MRVLVVGNGGREHALAMALRRSPRVGELFITRPNGGQAALGQAVDIAPDDVDGLVAFVRRERIDLTVVGPERPLTLGLVDALNEAGFRAFGPTARAAELEGSKAHAKAIMLRAGVPTAEHRTFEDLSEARRWVREFGRPVVVKADGLAAGKGVVLCHTVEEADVALSDMLEGGAFGQAGRRVVVEELLSGEEASFIAVCDGEHVLALASSQDHKRVGEGDTGPNTGGMGAYSPAPVVTPELERELMERVMRPVVRTMAAEGAPFLGFLYAGVMVTAEGPMVLEFNVRLGDPETQPLLTRLQTDLVDLIEATLDGRLAELELRWDPRAALCVVMASEGYPEAPRTGDVIAGLEEAASVADTVVHQAGTRLLSDGTVHTSGGRVLSVTGLGVTVAEAAGRAYEAVARIRWRGEHHRRDIGYRAIAREGQREG